MNTLSGISIHVIPDPRRYGDLPDDVCVPAAFRADFNAWSARFFPPDPALNTVPDGQAYMLHGRTAIMNPRTYAALRAAIKP